MVPVPFFGTHMSYFRAVPVRTERCRWTDYHPTTWSPSISMPRPLPTLPVHATHCPLPRPTASALSHAEPARVSRLRVVQHHFAPFFSFPLLSCYSLLHESVRLYGLSTGKPEYTNTCMGADTRFEAEQQFIAYAQELTDDCGLNDEGVVRELMKCVPVHMRQEMASYGTIHDVDGFLAAFINYFTPKIADFFATFMSGDPLQLPHETLKDFVQQRFYQLLLGTRGLPPAGAMVTGSNQNPFWVDFVHHTFTSVYWESAHKAITTLNNTGCDWNSLRTWSAFLQKVPFAGALRDTPERTATAAPPTRTFGAMEVQLPPALPGGMANEPTYTHSQVHQPPNQVNASMLRVMFDDPYPEVNFSSMMRVQSTAAPRQSCCPTTPCHKLSSIVESPPQEPDPAPKPPVPPALLSPTPVLISATTFPESEAETVEAPPPASSPSTGQTRQQMPRQAEMK